MNSSSNIPPRKSLDVSPTSDLNSISNSQPNEENILPDEILLKIFSYSNRDFQTLQQAKLVNKQWNRVAQDQTLDRALQILCKCSHPLILSQTHDKSYKSFKTLDTSNNLIVGGYGQKRIFTYNIAEEKKELNLSSIYSTSIFSTFIDDKLYIGTDEGLFCYHGANYQEKENLGNVQTNPRIDHIFTQSAHKNYIAYTGLTANTIHVFNPETEQTIEIHDQRNGRDRHCTGLTFAGNFLVASYTVFNREAENYIIVYDLDKAIENEDLYVFHENFIQRPSLITAGQNHFAVQFNNSSIKLFNIKSQKEEYDLNSDIKWEDPENSFNSCSVFKIVDEKLYIATSDGYFKVFDVNTGQLISELNRKDGSPVQVNFEAFSIQDNIIALGVNLKNKQYAVELWDTNTGKLVHSFPTLGSVDKVKLEMGDHPQLTVGINGGAVQVWNPTIELKQRQVEEVSSNPVDQTISPIVSPLNKKGFFSAFLNRIGSFGSWLREKFTAFLTLFVSKKN